MSLCNAFTLNRWINKSYPLSPFNGIINIQYRGNTILSWPQSPCPSLFFSFLRTIFIALQESPLYLGVSLRHNKPRSVKHTSQFPDAETRASLSLRHIQSRRSRPTRDAFHCRCEMLFISFLLVLFRSYGLGLPLPWLTGLWLEMTELNKIYSRSKIGVVQGEQRGSRATKAAFTPERYRRLYCFFHILSIEDMFIFHLL